MYSTRELVADSVEASKFGNTAWRRMVRRARKSYNGTHGGDREMMIIGVGQRGQRRLLRGITHIFGEFQVLNCDPIVKEMHYVTRYRLWQVSMGDVVGI